MSTPDKTQGSDDVPETDFGKSLALNMDNSVKEAVEKLTDYMVTYDTQPGYESYGEETYINDVLYGLAVSMSPKFRFANGFKEFKRQLLEFLND